MKSILVKSILRSVRYHRKDAIYQFIIVALLTAVVTGSFLTGESVKKSLMRTSAEKLGNTNILISSGLRYFNSKLAFSIKELTSENCVALMELEGYCQNFSTGATALDINIYGVKSDFFLFNNSEPLAIEPGTAAINDRLASYLNIREGEDIIVYFRDADPLPRNAPFAPKEDNQSSRVLKVSRILNTSQSGNFSLGISQVLPMNIFMNLSDIGNQSGKEEKSNRILISNQQKADIGFYSDVLKKTITLEDAGLKLRMVPVSGEPELVSERIFIDSAITEAVLKRFPSASPVLTYLANSISLRERTSPYSFVAAVSSQATKGLRENEIIINRWVSEDIGARRGDTLRLTWFVQDISGNLEEEKQDFVVAGIAGNEGIYSDSTLMPDFPGISGRTTCSGWDAGIPLMLDRIRKKDEEYWNRFKGTPKAFISYEAGKKIWANRFGTATSIRFPASFESADAEKKLIASIEPANAGFSVTDIRKASADAAKSGTDFGSLFLSLSIFVIAACIILLSLAVALFFDTRKLQVNVLYALGFRNKSIKNLLLTEAMILSLAGSVAGVILGGLMNVGITTALNGVWKGAVQTDTLTPGFSVMPFAYGIIISLLITAALILIKARSFLRALEIDNTGESSFYKHKKNWAYSVSALVLFIMLIAAAFISESLSTTLFFTSGSALFVAMVLFIRQYYLKEKGERRKEKGDAKTYARKYFLFHPGQVTTPVTIIAAGIFAVIITAANRQVVSEKSLQNSGGTGGYLLWAESALPVMQDLGSAQARAEFGLDEEALSDLEFVQAKKLKGDDASCLNLNHITSPPLIGINPDSFIARGSFSFSSELDRKSGQNPWNLLKVQPGERSIYAIADQTVLEWNLKMKAGDTLMIKDENGERINIIICAGLKSSVFQGNLVIHEKYFSRYFPSVPGNSVFLIDGKPDLKEYYHEVLDSRLSPYGFSSTGADDKLASFLEVTNTYLNVFSVFGIFGLILGVAGLGFILLKNFNLRRKEFALLSASGFSPSQIRKYILNDHLKILFWGIITGIFSGLTSTLPSLLRGSGIPWAVIIFMAVVVSLTGFTVLLYATVSVSRVNLMTELKKE